MLSNASGLLGTTLSRVVVVVVAIRRTAERATIFSHCSTLLADIGCKSWQWQRSLQKEAGLQRLCQRQLVESRAFSTYSFFLFIFYDFMSSNSQCQLRILLVSIGIFWFYAFFCNRFSINRFGCHRDFISRILKIVIFIKMCNICGRNLCDKTFSHIYMAISNTLLQYSIHTQPSLKRVPYVLGWLNFILHLFGIPANFNDIRDKSREHDRERERKIARTQLSSRLAASWNSLYDHVLSRIRYTVYMVYISPSL